MGAFFFGKDENMTVQKLYVKNKYFGDGANTVFPITFEWAKKHSESIQVWVRNNAGVLTKTDNFLLKTSSNEDIWNVVYPSVGDPLGQGETITIVRELSLLQVLNLVNQGPFFAEDVEITFDELVMMIQQLNEKLARSFKVAVDIDGENTFDTTVPIEPGKSFRVKDDGTGFEVTEDPAQVLPLAKSELEAVKREHAEAVQDLTVIKDEAVSAKTDAQSAANVAQAIKGDVEEIAGDYSIAKDVLDNVNVYKNQAQGYATQAESAKNVANTKANEASASASLAGQKADNASASASSASQASASAIETLRATTLIKNSGNADNLSTANATDIVEIKDIFSSYIENGYYHFYSNLFVRGSWYTSSFGNEKYRVRNESPFYTEKTLTLVPKDGFRIGVFASTNSETRQNLSGWQAEPVSIPAYHYYWLNIARVTDITTETANIFEYVSNVIINANGIQQIEKNTQDIHKNSNVNTELYVTDECIMANQNYRLRLNVGIYEETTSAITVSNAISCSVGDALEYKLSSDNAILVTYDQGFNIVNVVNGSGYNDYKTGTYIFSDTEKYFRVSGAISRYNQGLYSLKYNANYKRFESIEEKVEQHDSNIAYLNASFDSVEPKERVSSNDEYISNGIIRKCYNPYKNTGTRQLTGQMHCHDRQRGSDGNVGFIAVNSRAESLANYKAAGYDWCTITNYSHLLECYPTLDSDVPSNFTYLCDSMEIPVKSGRDKDGVSEKIKHICTYNTHNFNTDNNDGWWTYKTITEFAELYKNEGAMISLSHPYWTDTYQNVQALDKVKGRLRFCEVWDGLVEYYRELGTKGDNYVSYPTGKSSDFAWERLLDNGNVTWCTAISDLHTGRNESVVKRGCVKVFANANNRFEILKNLSIGNFYASSNVDFSLSSVSFVDGVYTVTTSDSSAKTVFMKEQGTIVKEVIGASASYKLTGDEKYVRAVVYKDTGRLDYQGVKIYEKIWTQPIINVFKPDYDDYFSKQ